MSDNKQPRPASPTPEQPAQDLTETEIAQLDESIAGAKATGWGSAWRWAERLIAEVKRHRALAPPAQTQQGLSEEEGALCMAVTRNGHRCSREPHEELDDNHEAEGAADNGGTLLWTETYPTEKQPLPSAAPAQEGARPIGAGMEAQETADRCPHAWTRANGACVSCITNALLRRDDMHTRRKEKRNAA